MTISIGIIVKNEAQLLADCVKLVKEHFDEIIVVDNGSSDNSVEVAKTLRCKTIESPDTVLDQCRNIAIENCMSDWIFFIRLVPQ